MSEETTNEEQRQSATGAENAETVEGAESRIPSGELAATAAEESLDALQDSPAVDTDSDEKSASNKMPTSESLAVADVKQIFHESVSELWTTFLEPNLENLFQKSSEKSAVDPEQIARQSATQLRHTLKTDFDKVLSVPDQVDRSLSRVISTMLDRIEDPQGRFALNLQRSLLRGLLNIYDLVQDLEENVKKPLSDTQHWKNYSTIRTQMIQLFALNDIQPLTPEVGTEMNAQCHRAVEVVPTSEPAEDNCIAKRHRDGFTFGSIVLRPAEVTLKKYSEVAEPNAEPELISGSTSMDDEG
jgi:molecular chaperone GrpE (heat shock protein)